MQTPNDEDALLLIELDLLPRSGKGSVEPLLEGGAGLEDGGEQEVEQSPQLRELVLQRRA